MKEILERYDNFGKGNRYSKDIMIWEKDRDIRKRLYFGRRIEIFERLR